MLTAADLPGRTRAAGQVCAFRLDRSARPGRALPEDRRLGNETPKDVTAGTGGSTTRCQRSRGGVKDREVDDGIHSMYRQGGHYRRAGRGPAWVTAAVRWTGRRPLPKRHAL